MKTRKEEIDLAVKNFNKACEKCSKSFIETAKALNELKANKANPDKSVNA